MEKAEIAIVDEQTLRKRIFIVRGIPVMFDFDLAVIYGYTTKKFNQQVKNNEEVLMEKIPTWFDKSDLDLLRVLWRMKQGEWLNIRNGYYIERSGENYNLGGAFRGQYDGISAVEAVRITALYY